MSIRFPKSKLGLVFVSIFILGTIVGLIRSLAEPWASILSDVFAYFMKIPFPMQIAYVEIIVLGASLLINAVILYWVVVLFQKLIRKSKVGALFAGLYIAVLVVAMIFFAATCDELGCLIVGWLPFFPWGNIEFQLVDVESALYRAGYEDNYYGFDVYDLVGWTRILYPLLNIVIFYFLGVGLQKLFSRKPSG